jgi:hypothetical protein
MGPRGNAVPKRKYLACTHVSKCAANAMLVLNMCLRMSRTVGQRDMPFSSWLSGHIFRCGMRARLFQSMDRVRTWLSLQNDRTTIRHDQATPNQQDARLAERDLAVVDADQARSLRPLNLGHVQQH